MRSARPAAPDTSEPWPEQVWVVQVRGRTRVLRDDVEVTLRPKERAVLASLARREVTLASTQEIGEDVWGEHLPATANKSVHNHIARLRRSAPDLIETVDGRYRINGSALVDATTMTGNGVIPYSDLADTGAIVGSNISKLQNSSYQCFDRSPASG